MGCCKKFFSPKTRQTSRSVLCLKYVAPLRLVTVVSIWADVFYALFNLETLSLTFKFFMLIHLIAAASILVECQRSVRYHEVYGAPKN